MTATSVEQYPLLHDDYSEEERFGRQQRFRPMTIRNRVRNKVRGAAFLLKRWPGYWSTVLLYWWIATGMIVITTLFIYNGIAVYALIPTEYNRLPYIEKPSTFDVLMHVHVKIDDEIDVTKFLPHLSALSTQYNEYTYHLIVVVNDVNSPIDLLKTSNDNINNEVALQSLLNEEVAGDKKSLIKLEQIFLTKYLDTSPISKRWRNMPHHFIEFMVRAISIWERGGLAFNPIMLIPNSPYTRHMEKVKTLLEIYKESSRSLKTVSLEKTTNENNNLNRPKVNNIRDIIDAMELLDDNNLKIEARKNEEFTSLETAESRFFNPFAINLLNDTKIVSDKITGSFQQKNNAIKLSKNDKNVSQEPKKYTPNFIGIDDANNKLDEISYTVNNNNSNTLPVIFKYLSSDKNKQNVTRQRKSIIYSKPVGQEEKNKRLSMDNRNINITSNHFEPNIIYSNINIANNDPSNVTINDKKSHVNINSNQSIDQLTIDLSGNILATKAPCHAFIGTLFSNVLRHESEDTVSEFIMDELSLFCKNDSLTSCNGIDVIFP